MQGVHHVNVQICWSTDSRLERVSSDFTGHNFLMQKLQVKCERLSNALHSGLACDIESDVLVSSHRNACVCSFKV
jgi:hypothetical protein